MSISYQILSPISGMSALSPSVNVFVLFARFLLNLIEGVTSLTNR